MSAAAQFSTPGGLLRAASGAPLSLELGGGAGTLTCEAGLRASRPSPELGCDAADVPDGFVLDLASATRAHTYEGEHAILARGTGPRGADASYGFVYLDDTYLRVVGVARDDLAGARVRAAVRDLVLGAQVFLTGARRRRFLYQPPPGWSAITDGRDATWLPPAAAAWPVSMTVPAAQPATAASGAALVGRLLGLTDPGAPLCNVRRRFGLEGKVWERVQDGADGSETRNLVFCLGDGSHDYAARLVAPVDGQAERGLLEALVNSIRPLPPSAAAGEPVSAALAFWAV